MIQHIVERVMEFDVENLCNAAYGERSAERANCRNGYRERLWETRAGAVNVQIPKLRKGSYFPPFLEPRRTAEPTLAAVIQEAYVQGVSTRSIDELVKAMGMSGISKSQVSRCAPSSTVRPLGWPPSSAEHESNRTRTHDSYTTPRDTIEAPRTADGTRSEPAAGFAGTEYWLVALFGQMADYRLVESERHAPRAGV
jgi:putative transposase